MIEGGDKEDWFTTGVDLIVDRALRENGTLTLGQGVTNEASTVLLNKSGFHFSFDEVKDLGCSGMGMRGVHATGSVAAS